MEIPETPDGTVDVATVVARLREQVRLDRQRGVFTQEDTEREERLRLRRFGEQAKIDPKLLDALLHPSHDWNIRVDYLVRKGRPGLAGWLIVLAKKLVRPFVRLYTDHILDQQTQINLYVSYFLKDAVAGQLRLENEVRQLRHRLNELEGGNGA
jgi:hypothetical protein